MTNRGWGQLTTYLITYLAGIILIETSSSSPTPTASRFLSCLLHLVCFSTSFQLLRSLYLIFLSDSLPDWNPA